MFRHHHHGHHHHHHHGSHHSHSPLLNLLFSAAAPTRVVYTQPPVVYSPPPTVIYKQNHVVMPQIVEVKVSKEEQEAKEALIRSNILIAHTDLIAEIAGTHPDIVSQKISGLAPLRADELPFNSKTNSNIFQAILQKQTASVTIQQKAAWIEALILQKGYKPYTAFLFSNFMQAQNQNGYAILKLVFKSVAKKYDFMTRTQQRNFLYEAIKQDRNDAVYYYYKILTGNYAAERLQLLVDSINIHTTSEGVIAAYDLMCHPRFNLSSVHKDHLFKVAKQKILYIELHRKEHEPGYGYSQQEFRDIFNFLKEPRGAFSCLFSCFFTTTSVNIFSCIRESNFRAAKTSLGREDGVLQRDFFNTYQIIGDQHEERNESRSDHRREPGHR